MADPIRKDSLHVPLATLLALAQRAEAGGDDAISHAVWIALGWKNKTTTAHITDVWENPQGDRVPFDRPDLRRSLDAVEEVPGRIARIRRLPNSEECCAWIRGRDGNLLPHAQAPTECLARLAAKLRALAAQKESGGG